MVNTNKIKGRMREMEITQKEVAKYLGIQQSTVNQKINNFRCFSLEEAEKMCILLNITPDEFASYFFV